MSLQDQMEGESPKAYEAYKIYRDMGINRTVIGSYALYLKSMGKDNPKSA